MALFDAATASGMGRYERFREWFVDEYRAASGLVIADELLAEAIDIRVSALARWIEHPESAPVGIRTATPEWRETLRAFVTSQAGR